jgi:predicted dehydrogenase
MKSNTLTTRVGILGCGNISSHYFEGCARLPDLQVVACADADEAKARAMAEQYGVAAESNLDTLASRDDVDIIVNLTIPSAHAETTCRLLAAGKHVYCEKPFALSVEEGRKVLAQAATSQRRVGSAPANYLAAVGQTARRILDSGTIGRTVAASAFWGNRGPEAWHPAPQSFYASSAGPFWDTGPYPLADVLNYFGPIAAVTTLAVQGIPERECLHPSLSGKMFGSDCATHVIALLETHSGVAVNLTASFDIHAHRCPLFEIYGTEGSLSVPSFAVQSPMLLLKTASDPEWREVPPDPGSSYIWGLGVSEMASALRENSESRVDASRALHLLEVMESARETTVSRHVMRTVATRPDPFLRPDLIDI